MAITTDVISVINDICQEVGDVGATRRTLATYLMYVNDGQLKAAKQSANVNPMSVNFNLVAGALQTLPSDAIKLIEIPFNTSSDGSVIGLPINKSDLPTVISRNSSWTADPASISVGCYMYNEDNPLQFYVYPVQPATPGYVKLIYSAIPANIANYTAGTKITISDDFSNALFNYGCYRCYSEDSAFGNQADKRDHHFAQYLSELGLPKHLVDN
jgi:hypothetical protein